MNFSSKKKVMALALGATILMFSKVGMAQQVLEKGMSGQDVVALQQDLTKLGHYNYSVTGYFGTKTKSAVEDFQKTNGLVVDGIVGRNTLNIIKNVLKSSSSLSSNNGFYTKSWFDGGTKVFAIGKVGTVYDIDTGKSFKVMRTFGYNHADCETLTKEDTRIMKEIYGGQWSWERRAIILTVDGIKIPASMAGMPHAGVDSEPACKYVSWRSGGFGAGQNLDSIKGNGMDGHFDIHLLRSKTHATGVINQAHQNMVQKAFRTLQNMGK